MGTTPTYSWPYPESTDPVANGAQDIEDLALAVETTVSGLPAGKILQVVSTSKTDTFSSSLASGATTALTGLTAAITPSSTLNTIFVIVSINGATVAGSDKPGTAYFRITAAGSPILIGDAASNRTRLSAGALGLVTTQGIQNATAFGIDSPATTSSVTYGLDVYNPLGVTATVYVNRTADDTDLATFQRTISTITVMEISA